MTYCSYTVWIFIYCSAQPLSLIFSCGCLTHFLVFFNVFFFVEEKDENHCVRLKELLDSSSVSLEITKKGFHRFRQSTHVPNMEQPPHFKALHVWHEWLISGMFQGGGNYGWAQPRCTQWGPSYAGAQMAQRCLSWSIPTCLPEWSQWLAGRNVTLPTQSIFV